MGDAMTAACWSHSFPADCTKMAVLCPCGLTHVVDLDENPVPTAWAIVDCTCGRVITVPR